MIRHPLRLVGFAALAGHLTSCAAISSDPALTLGFTACAAVAVWAALAYDHDQPRAGIGSAHQNRRATR